MGCLKDRVWSLPFFGAHGSCSTEPADVKGQQRTKSHHHKYIYMVNQTLNNDCRKKGKQEHEVNRVKIYFNFLTLGFQTPCE